MIWKQSLHECIENWKIEAARITEESKHKLRENGKKW